MPSTRFEIIWREHDQVRYFKCNKFPVCQYYSDAVQDLLTPSKVALSNAQLHPLFCSTIGTLPKMVKSHNCGGADVETSALHFGVKKA